MFRPADGPKLLTGPRQRIAVGEGVRARTDKPGSRPTLANWKESPVRHLMKWLTAIVLCAGMAIPVLPAQAKVPGPNGQIAFSRYVQDDNTVGLPRFDGQG
jgi:hypothetical protein